MSPKGYAFVNAEMIVVNAIGGDLDADALKVFESDYRVLFGAEFSVPVFDGMTVWIGGRYNPDDGTFSPPEPIAQPEPMTEEIVP